MKRTISVALLVLFAAGCGGDNPPPAASGEEKAPAATAVPAVQPSAAAPRAVILPERLQSVSTAVATVAGCSGPVRYLWSVNGQPVAEVAGDRLAPEHFRRDDEVAVSVQCDGTTATASARVTNSPPQVTRVGFRNPVIVAGQEIVAVPEAVDPDGDTAEFEYQWLIDGTDVPVTAAALPGTYVRSGQQIVLNVIAYDHSDRNTPYRGEPFIVAGAPPRFTTQPPQSFQLLDYRYQAKAVDPDGDQVTYRLETAPPGMAIDPRSGLVTWTIAPGTTGEFRVKIIAEDATGLYAGQEYTFGLQPRE